MDRSDAGCCIKSGRLIRRRDKRGEEGLLLDLLVGVAGGIVFAVGTLLILILYCYMRTVERR